MAVNLFQNLFETKIACSAVSLDGYSPQNLISESWRERNCGFLAAHFIKPPVNLLVQLPFPINVHSLVIKPKVGSQISSGIDVFVAGIKHDFLGETSVVKDTKSRQIIPLSSGPSCNGPKTKRRRVESGLTYTGREAEKLASQNAEENFKNFAHKYSTLITPDSFKNEHKNIFTLVGRVNEPLGRTIRMSNKRYGGKIDPAAECSGDAAIHDFFQCRRLNYVTHLVVVISRVKGSCVPAVGRLEIWGQPSSCCGASIMNYVSDIQKKISRQQENESAASKATKNGSNGSLNGNITKDNEKGRCLEDEKIPSEYIDPITCSFMTIPMLLPSGLNIDLSTLEKHIEAERSWGRLPSDPFTGVLFSEEVKPLPNGALKVRIDKYILTSGVDVRSCGRTVGRSHDSIFPRSSLRNCSEKEVVSGLDGKLTCELQENETMEVSKNKKGLGQPGLHDGNKEDSTDVVSNEIPTDLTQSHEEKVSESLDNALMKTLGAASFTRRYNSHIHAVMRNNTSSLPCPSSLVENLGLTKSGPSIMTSTSKDSHKTQGHFTSSDCIGCKSSLSALSMFQLPCKHLMCRKCLTDQSKVTKTLKCSLCGCECKQRDVIRVHH